MIARRIARRAGPQLAADGYCATMKSLKKSVSGAFIYPFKVSLIISDIAHFNDAEVNKRNDHIIS